VVMHRFGVSKKKNKLFVVLTDGQISDIQDVATKVRRLGKEHGVYSVFYEIGMGDRGPGFQEARLKGHAPYEFSVFAHGEDASGLGPSVPTLSGQCPTRTW